jgi:hypothetical protein
MFEEGMTVKCISHNWYSFLGELSMVIPLGTKLTVKKAWRFRNIPMLDFIEYPDNSFMASGFKPHLN